MSFLKKLFGQQPQTPPEPVAPAPPSASPSVAQSERIAYLLNSRIYREKLPKSTWLHNSQVIEEEMTFYRHLPYKIGNCFYIGEHKAWSGYNLQNKEVLAAGLAELNNLISAFKHPDKELNKLLSTRCCVDVRSICFDFSDRVRDGDLPRSYIIYAPKTKTGKSSQYPLIAYFNTIKNNIEESPICATGELYYSVNGDLAKATIYTWVHRDFTEYTFGVIGRTFGITRIRKHGKRGTLADIYRADWELNNYADFI